MNETRLTRHFSSGIVLCCLSRQAIIKSCNGCWDYGIRHAGYMVHPCMGSNPTENSLPICFFRTQRSVVCFPLSIPRRLHSTVVTRNAFSAFISQAHLSRDKWGTYLGIYMSQATSARAGLSGLNSPLRLIETLPRPAKRPLVRLCQPDFRA